MLEISAVANERSTFILRVSFHDEDGNDAVPTAASWTLTDKDGIVINNRSDVPISPTNTTVDIVLSGDDLALGGYAATKYQRLVTIKALYDSTAGVDLPLTDQIAFYVQSNITIT